ncbi:MAG TPA: alcohol dehydrogenase catalytic domain-containing protein [Bacteriovoracaceae bacterium]|nr:alcohol dehydrogenase catalytic domain-containing protein [Bacteriovoracaceae bacterium]
MKNKTAYFIRKNESFELREEELGSLPSPYHVLVKNKWVGICGSDINALEIDFLDEIVLGHEWVGEIIEVGSQVEGFSVGDYVTSGNKIQCGYCLPCREDKGECENLMWLTANHGMFKEYAYLPFGPLIKLPGVGTQSTTLFEILAVAENVWLKESESFKRCSGSILIMGAGLLGLSVALVLKRENIDFEMIEMIPSRIQRAHKLGLNCRHLAEALMDPKSRDAYQCIVDATGDHLGSAGGWKNIEHFGSPSFLAIILAKYIHEIPFKSFRFFSKQANLRWIQGCTNDSLIVAIDSWKESIEELGKVLITHSYTLDEIEEAFNTAKDRKVSGRVIVKV